jgi:hypothetical protein
MNAPLPAPARRSASLSVLAVAISLVAACGSPSFTACEYG